MPSENSALDWDRFRKNWDQLKGAVGNRWQRLSPQRLDQMDGDREELLDELQKAYGLTHEEADAQLNAFLEENEEYFDLVRDTSASTSLSPRP